MPFVLPCPSWPVSFIPISHLWPVYPSSLSAINGQYASSNLQALVCPIVRCNFIKTQSLSIFCKTLFEYSVPDLYSGSVQDCIISSALTLEMINPVLNHWFICMKTYCGLVEPDGNWYWFKWWHVASQPQAITWTSVDLLTRSSSFHVRTVLMMTSSNGNIFHVTGHLCGEFTGLRWIPRTKASDAELWCFLWSAPE